MLGWRLPPWAPACRRAWRLHSRASASPPIFIVFVCTRVAREGPLRQPPPRRRGPGAAHGGPPEVAEGDASGEVQTVGPRPPVLHPADGRRRVVPPLRLLLDIMGAALASVSASATEPLPHLSVHGAPIVSRISVSSVRELRLGKCGSNFVFCSNAGGRARSGVSRCRRPRRCSTSCSSTWRHQPAQGAGGRRRPALPEACARSMRRSASGVARPHGCQSPVVQGVQCCH